MGIVRMVPLFLHRTRIARSEPARCLVPRRFAVTVIKFIERQLSARRHRALRWFPLRIAPLSGNFALEKKSTQFRGSSRPRAETPRVFARRKGNGNEMESVLISA